MAEGLGRYIKTTVLEGSLKGLPLHNIQPAPSHSQFIDDTLLMNTPTAREANKLNSILSDFVEASGMALNLDKSKLYFFNTPIVVQNHISRLLGIPKSSLPSNYLGIPLTGAQQDPSLGTTCFYPSLTGLTTGPLDPSTLQQDWCFSSQSCKLCLPTSSQPWQCLSRSSEPSETSRETSFGMDTNLTRNGH
jgi:hypothetical protein